VGIESHASEVLTVTHGSFIFRFTETDHGLVNALEQRVSQSKDRLTEELGVVHSGPITVVLAPDDQAFNQFQPSGDLLPSWAIGVAYPERMTMVIRSYHMPGTPRQDIGTIFIHELTHLLLAARFGDRPIPRWLHEGLATYEAYEWHPGQEWDLMLATISGRVPALEDLTQGFGRGVVEERLGYLLSYTLVNYMVVTYGRKAFGNFVARLGGGGSFEEALIGAYGVSLPLFEQRWRDHLDRRHTWMPIITSSSALWVVVMAVTVAAYWARRRRNARIRGAWEAELEDGSGEADDGQVH